MRLLHYSLFPYLFALALPITVYSHNQAAFAAVDLLRPALVCLLIAASLVVIFRSLVSNRALADTMASVPLIGVWLLGVDWQLYLALGILVIACAALRKRSLPAQFVPVLNALAIGVLFLPTTLIFRVESVVYADSRTRTPSSPFTALRTSLMGGEKPDIYHIVLDAYAGADALTGQLGFDNSEFFDDLRGLDFLVGESVIVPYNETVHTMSAIFLGEYLRSGEFPLDSDFPSLVRSSLGDLIPNGPVHDVLRTNGYSLVYTDPGHEFLRFPQDAFVLRSDDHDPLNMFEMHLGKVTGLDLMFPALYEVKAEDPLIRSVRHAFASDFSAIASPKFVYQHVLAPHTPFVIDRTGAKTTEFPGFSTSAEGDAVVLDSPGRRELYVRGYLEKLRYVNTQVLEQIRKLRALPHKKIIVIHGDHGSGAYYFTNDASRTCLRERFTSFIAVYSDDPRVRDEFQWVSDPDAAPVNIYRSIFNALLGLDLALLPRQASFVNFSAPHQLQRLDPGLIPRACSVASVAGVTDVQKSGPALP